MGLKTFGSGWDPSSGWAPDESTSQHWDPKVDLPGRWVNGQFVPDPATPPPSGSTTITSVPPNTHGDGPPIAPDQVTPPESSPIRPGMSPGPFTGGTSTENMGPRASGLSGVDWRHPFAQTPVDPNQPRLLTGPGGGGFNPLSLLGGGNPYWRGAIAAGGVLTPSELNTGEFHPAMITGRPDAPLPLHMPHRPVTPTPTTAYPPIPLPPARPVTARGPVSPASAGPAAVAQQPNLGNYNPFVLEDRPNMSPQNSLQGRQGAPKMGMLDLSRFFGGGQSAPAAAAPAPAAAAPVYNQPSTQLVSMDTDKAPWGYGPLQQGNIWKPSGTRTPSGPRRKGSRPDQGG